jgi:hypothetical protein
MGSSSAARKVRAGKIIRSDEAPLEGPMGAPIRPNILHRLRRRICFDMQRTA